LPVRSANGPDAASKKRGRPRRNETEEPSGRDRTRATQVRPANAHAAFSFLFCSAVACDQYLAIEREERT
jgi:hypothetical protein